MEEKYPVDPVVLAKILMVSMIEKECGSLCMDNEDDRERMADFVMKKMGEQMRILQDSGLLKMK